MAALVLVVPAFVKFSSLYRSKLCQADVNAGTNVMTGFVQMRLNSLHRAVTLSKPNQFNINHTRILLGDNVASLRNQREIHKMCIGSCKRGKFHRSIHHF